MPKGTAPAGRKLSFALGLGDQVILGAVPMEDLDLIISPALQIISPALQTVSPALQTVEYNPQSPNLPMALVK